MDIKTKEQRSYNMSRIKSKNTKPELVMFKVLKKHGIKFKKHYNISGKPDIVIPEYKVAVFVNGEFWHGKDYKRIKNRIPKFWKTKIGINLKRDRKVRRDLRNKNWHVINFWGRKVVRDPERSFRRLQKFLEKINNQN